MRIERLKYVLAGACFSVALAAFVPKPGRAPAPAPVVLMVVPDVAAAGVGAAGVVEPASSPIVVPVLSGPNCCAIKFCVRWPKRPNGIAAATCA